VKVNEEAVLTNTPIEKDAASSTTTTEEKKEGYLRSIFNMPGRAYNKVRSWFGFGGKSEAVKSETPSESAVGETDQGSSGTSALPLAIEDSKEKEGNVEVTASDELVAEEVKDAIILFNAKEKETIDQDEQGSSGLNKEEKDTINQHKQGNSGLNKEEKEVIEEKDEKDNSGKVEITNDGSKNEDKEPTNKDEKDNSGKNSNTTYEIKKEEPIIT
jgi:hypothetical protein